MLKINLKNEYWAEVVEEGAKVSRNYLVVIVFMQNLWNVIKVFPSTKKHKFFHVSHVSYRNFGKGAGYWAVLKIDILAPVF